MQHIRIITGLVVAMFMIGCASRPINDRITKVDLNNGYRPYVQFHKRENNDPSTLFVMSFSGGGTRAAAFSYGVLEELRSVQITVDGQNRLLLDEVDLITGVSGGSFTALSYALYGDRLFSEYEQRFLKRNVQGALMWKVVNPFNWGKLMSGKYGRSEMAAEYYDEILFEGATFQDLIDGQGPVAIATGTDLVSGSRLAFYQNDFDLLCSDLSTLHLSRAAATSSAVPMVLSPVTLNNYGGSCGYEYPAWVADLHDMEEHTRPAGRALQRYREMNSFQDSANRPFLHLIDGGISDNIGVRGVMEGMEELGFSAEFREQVDFGNIRRIILIVVNAHSAKMKRWERRESPPGTFKQLGQSLGVPIERYSFETIEMMKDRAEIAEWKRRLRVAEARLAGATEEEAEAMFQKLDLHVLDVNFDTIRDPEKRAYLQNQPTSFKLPDEAVDSLREAAGELLRQSVEYQEILEIYGATDLPEER